MKYNKHFKSIISSLALISCMSTQAKGASIQIFPTLAYTNPASLALVHTFSTTAGGIALPVKVKFKGSNAGMTGSSTSNQKYYFPYFQAVYRLHPMWMIGFDISDPVFLNFAFKNGIANGYRDRIFAKNYSPKICFQPSEDLAFGFGIDIQHIWKAELSFALPVGLLQNLHGHGTKAGWDAGFLYKITPTDIISGSFHSQITQIAHGTSWLNGVSTAATANIKTPATTSLNYLHIFNQEWLVNLTARFVKWNVVKNLVLTNTPAGTLIIPQNYSNTWVGQGVVRYQFAEQWAGLLAAEYDSSPQKASVRSIPLPAAQVWIGAIGLQYLPTKEIQFQFVYGHARSHTKINNNATASFGKENIDGNFFDLNVTYKF